MNFEVTQVLVATSRGTVQGVTTLGAEGMALPGSGSYSIISMEPVGNHRFPDPLGLWRTDLAL